jgi:hypothetical protein
LVCSTSAEIIFLSATPVPYAMLPQIQFHNLNVTKA